MGFDSGTYLAQALIENIVFSIVFRSQKKQTPKVAEAAKNNCLPNKNSQDSFFSEPQKKQIEKLVQNLVQTLLGLERKKPTPDQLNLILEKAYKKYLSYSSPQDMVLKARINSLFPQLMNIGHVAGISKQGLKLDPLNHARFDQTQEIVIGHSKAFAQVLEDLNQIANTDLTVLLYGESGTGKEIMARRLHALSNRSQNEFVPINCAALSTTLLESELFGHKKGSFTGADSSNLGYFRAAKGGTLFLDEIGSSSTKFQLSLLRVLEDRIVTPVGQSQGEFVDFRLVCATSENLETLSSKGEFNLALLHRLMVIPIELPSLKQRPEDIPALLDHFLEQACLLAKRTRRLSPETKKALLSYSWPGNIRQLKHLLQRMVALSPEYEIKPELLPKEIRLSEPRTEPLEKKLKTLEKIPSLKVKTIAHALLSTNGKFFSNKELRNALRCSDSTAKNILRALADAGMLEVIGQRGGRKYKLLAV